MRLGFGCAFLDANLDGHLDLAAVNGHIDETVRNITGNHGYAQPPHLFLNDGKGGFHDVAAQLGGGFAAPKVGRGLAYGDFDRDGDLDLLLTTNQGPAYLYRNDLTSGNRSLRFRLQRDEIESRRHRRDGARHHAGGDAVAHGEDGFQLPVAIGAGGDVRAGQARPGGPRGDRMAQRPGAGVQERERRRVSMH